MTSATPVREDTPNVTRRMTTTSMSWKMQVQLKWKKEDALQDTKVNRMSLEAKGQTYKSIRLCNARES